jgi:hypothetical protein
VNHEDTHHVLDTNHVSVVQSNGHLAGIEKGSLGLNYLGFFDGFFDNSSNFVNREDTHHVSNTNHVSILQSNGQLMGVARGVVGITPISEISLLVLNISLSPALVNLVHLFTWLTCR